MMGRKMSIQDQIEYHSGRARRELDQGLVAASVPAARAHLQLSSLHLARVRALSGAEAGMDHRPPMVMG